MLRNLLEVIIFQKVIFHGVSLEKNKISISIVSCKRFDMKFSPNILKTFLHSTATISLPKFGFYVAVVAHDSAESRTTQTSLMLCACSVPGLLGCTGLWLRCIGELTSKFAFVSTLYFLEEVSMFFF